MKTNWRQWISISLFSLVLVALLGLLMRYKIAYSFPWIDQKNLLHAHSHFAFAGWVSLALMTLMIRKATEISGTDLFKRYRFILLLQVLSAFGMLFSFTWQGYGAVSISFSTLSVVVVFVFAAFYWMDLKRIPAAHFSTSWFKAALLFNVLSVLGTFYLAYMMATKTANSEKYLASIYYYLHFQYNGWFFFGCMGLLSEWFMHLEMPMKKHRIIFRMFALSCIPAYFLSALWLPIPVAIYFLVVIAAFCQLIAWILCSLFLWSKRYQLTATIPSKYWWILFLSAIALTIKLLLQLGSTIPFLSKLAFGFRPIVIGYLHLVLLGVITLFILGYGFIKGFIQSNKISQYGIYIFASGILLNEGLLMIQGAAAIGYISITGINQLLIGASVVLFLGAAMMFWGHVTYHHTPISKVRAQ